jgi:hypothetical protein
MIRAEIIESDRCDAAGITVRANAPVLAMCRKLVEAGNAVACLSRRDLGTDR